MALRANCCLTRRSTLCGRVAQMSRAEFGFAFNSDREQQRSHRGGFPFRILLFGHLSL